MRVLVALLLLSGCAEVWQWDLPAGVEPPRVPADNPMTKAKVALGAKLFVDKNLSRSGELACASCHHPDRRFTEDRALSVADSGVPHHLNAPTLTNTAFLASYGWANPLLRTLERHATIPLFGETPVELGLTKARAEEVLQGYPELASADEPALVVVVQALASYQRTLLSFDSPYDADPTLMPDAFVAHCASCHAPPFFTNATSLRFENNGVGGAGLFDFTGQEVDRGFYKVPTLRGITQTSPYMHDGRMSSLPEVMAHYRSRFSLSDDEVADISAFLSML